MALVGNIVRITAFFYNFAGVIAEPDTASIAVRFYDSKAVQIGSTVILSAANKITTGVYKYDYTIPATTSSTIIYEFTGTVDGSPSLNRGVIPVRWV